MFCASELGDRDEEASTDGGNLSESAEVSTRNLDAAREISELRFLSLGGRIELDEYLEQQMRSQDLIYLFLK